MDAKERILIVDDDEGTRRSLSLIFDKKRYETETADTGREALEKIREKFFNLAILDIKLPDMEGVELIAPLKERHPDTVVIMATAYASVETAVRALNDGASAYIVKPMNMDEVLATIKETLEKQRLMLEKRQAEEQLRESEERLRTLIENAPDAIYVNDLDGKFIDGNKKTEQLLGYHKEELVGRSFLDAGILPEEYIPVALESLERNIRGEPTGPEEFELVTKEGSRVPVEITTFPVQRKGKVEVLGIARDSTARREAEEELARIKRDKDAQIIQSAKLASLGEMATNIAHEINQPLTVIKLTSSGLRRMMRRRETIDNEMLAEELESIDAQIERVRAIIDHMRTFVRRPRDTKSEYIDISVPLQDCFKFVGEQLRLDEVEVRMDLQKLPLLMANSNKVEQVFLNIIGNARDAMDDHVARVGHGHRKVLTVRSFVEDDEAVVTFSDTGGGIPHDVRDRIFEPFFTTKEVGRGTGLGLSVSYGIIADYGGTLGFWVDEGIGTTFRVALPLGSEPDT